MAGDWTTDDLTGVLSAFAANMRELVPEVLHRLRHAVLSRMPQSHDNTIEGARQNIQHHYDLSNDLFKTFLDESLTYSSAIFTGEPYGADDDLAAAQRRKIDRLLDCAGVGKGTKLLEIGTGWGELAIRAARRGAHGHLDDDLDRAGRAGPRADRRGRAQRQRRRPPRGLPRDDRTLRRDRQRRDDRGGRREPLGRVLHDDRPGARARWPGRAAGDPAGRLHGARHARHLHLDPQVHLPGRAARVGRGDRAHHHRAHQVAHRRPVQLRPALRGDVAAVAGAGSRSRRQRSASSASTRRSAGCGRCTSPIPKPASAPATSTSRR